MKHSTTARLRAELVQVAAVAVAAIEDLDGGSASMEDLAEVLANVAEERGRQNARWGAQHHPPSIWLAILAEEVGEVAREVVPLTERGDGWAPRVLVDPLLDAESAARWVLAEVEAVERLRVRHRRPGWLRSRVRAAGADRGAKPDATMPENMPAGGGGS